MPDCTRCGKGFARQFTLNRHLASVHGEKLGQHQCTECYEFFARNDILLRHKHTKHGSGMEACSICSQRFRKDYLVQHQSSCERRSRLPGQGIIGDVEVQSSAELAMEFDDLDWLHQSRENTFQPYWTVDEILDQGSLDLAVPQEKVIEFFGGSSESPQVTIPHYLPIEQATEQNPLSTASASVSVNVGSDVVDVTMEGHDFGTELTDLDSGDSVRYDNLGRVNVARWPSKDDPKASYLLCGV